MPPRLRKFALAVHLAFSVSWIGAVTAYVVLDLTAATSKDTQVLRGVWLSMALIVWWAIVPLALATLSTGLVMSLGTRWGLFRHWWVLISFLLTVGASIVLFVEAGAVARIAAMAADPSTSDERLRALGSTLPHSVGGLLVLLVIMALNIYKPPGVTRYGWRKQQEERSASSREGLE